MGGENDRPTSFPRPMWGEKEKGCSSLARKEKKDKTGARLSPRGKKRKRVPFQGEGKETEEGRIPRGKKGSSSKTGRERGEKLHRYKRIENRKGQVEGEIGSFTFLSWWEVGLSLGEIQKGKKDYFIQLVQKEGKNFFSFFLLRKSRNL